jgi:hypothetical protein
MLPSDANIRAEAFVRPVHRSNGSPLRSGLDSQEFRQRLSGAPLPTAERTRYTRRPREGRREHRHAHPSVPPLGWA